MALFRVQGFPQISDLSVSAYNGWHVVRTFFQALPSRDVEVLSLLAPVSSDSAGWHLHIRLAAQALQRFLVCTGLGLFRAYGLLGFKMRGVYRNLCPLDKPKTFKSTARTLKTSEASQIALSPHTVPEEDDEFRQKTRPFARSLIR